MERYISALRVLSEKITINLDYPSNDPDDLGDGRRRREYRAQVAAAQRDDMRLFIDNDGSMDLETWMEKRCDEAQAIRERRQREAERERQREEVRAREAAAREELAAELARRDAEERERRQTEESARKALAAGGEQEAGFWTRLRDKLLK